MKKIVLLSLLITAPMHAEVKELDLFRMLEIGIDCNDKGQILNALERRLEKTVGIEKNARDAFADLLTEIANLLSSPDHYSQYYKIWFKKQGSLVNPLESDTTLTETTLNAIHRDLLELKLQLIGRVTKANSLDELVEGDFAPINRLASPSVATPAIGHRTPPMDMVRKSRSSSRVNPIKNDSRYPGFSPRVRAGPRAFL